MTETAVYAAGGVVWRLVEGKLHVLAIHRTKYRDLTLPKGKVDPGETLAETAVREIHEETGIRVALGVPVGVSTYRLPSKRKKIVHYWSAEATDEAIRASAFVPNREIAAIEWLPPRKALSRLSYPVDIEILENFLRLVDDGVLATFPIVVLRHGKATPREDWKGKDADRPLTDRGRRQAKAVVGPLRSFGVQRVVSSDAVRCVDTVAPLAKALHRDIRRTELISQDAWEGGRADLRKVVGKRVRAGKPAVLCSHRPVLPELMSEIALATGTMKGSYLGSASSLETGGFSVVHLSATNPGSGIVAIETHPPKV
ncbi:NUDIX domain-containing protein [Microbacterium sp. EYE_5]|uniref:NUDIX hydrolase n=1 Tax=unclassified Microbacterium TaxID=2609290 RepID=UPI0020040990|nr:MULTISPECIES: NUDIX domain-containing protein [unclassified Microbacterium]MCK6081786.1 NUDIX domain-containing protein [Microbacterium sp. EYE_382]MCK6087056.1 NUDIX domain-containing protein [Microbacterium sp. EYE_384]MCK6124966.1 NUDIX domain-containing protein [Microbacterium sp. EYE_80]MCK6127819.1 NUDIX domain-containing protein [Microbacterium sp. EYE_79]MCK6142740.1 NUDIX domain-containing protein [Microbacterium sp. EYE_39]